MGRLEGKVAFVTGAGRGQGRSHAIRMAQEGADVIIVDICEDIPSSASHLSTEADLAETAAAVEALDRRVVAAKADVRDLGRLREIVDDGVAQLGGLDVVVANAGINRMRHWHQVTPQMWDDIVGTNLTGVWHTCAVSAPHLVQRGGGSMILTSSTAGIKGLPFLIPYAAAKHGVVGIMKALANELGIHHIRVNTIHPTGVDTPMVHVMATDGTMDLLAERPDLVGLMQNTLPVVMLQPGDISNAVVFLASDEGRYITGLQLKVDAGNAGR
jgi:SDR family mycofactocin-dependent oxidoreductase